MRNIEIKVPELDYSTSEAYKTLRTNLKFSGTDKKVIAVTSCMENEGKSTVIMNLGIALAEAGEKVVMVDCDLRKSVLLGRTKVGEEVLGLTHFLSRQAVLNDIVNVTNVNNFHMIYAGPTPPNPVELLGSSHFANMITALKKAYDYVLIDCPPLGMVIDAAVISQQCDGVMLVIESGYDSYRFVRSIQEQLEKAKCPILGVVLNKVDISKSGYYGHYYGKYGKYGKYGSYYGDYGNNSEKEEA